MHQRRLQAVYTHNKLEKKEKQGVVIFALLSPHSKLINTKASSPTRTLDHQTIRRTGENLD